MILRNAFQGDLLAGEDLLPTLRRLHVIAREFGLDEHDELTVLSSSFSRLKARKLNGLIGDKSYREGLDRHRVQAQTLVEAVFRHEVVAQLEKVLPAPQPLAPKVKLEAMISDTDALVDINWLNIGYQMRRAVCLIEVSDPRMQGTGFLCRMGSWTGIVTCHHVISSKEAAEKATISFDHETSVETINRMSYNLDSSSWQFLAELDVCLVKIKDPPGELPSPLVFSPSASPKQNDRVSIIQHPQGNQKKIALGSNKVIDTNEKDWLHYTTATLDGSSGSPVFNEMWQLVAVHRGARESNDRAGVFKANLGVRGKAILDAFEKEQQSQTES